MANRYKVLAAESSSRTVSAVADRTYTAVFEPTSAQPTLTIDLVNPDLGPKTLYAHFKKKDPEYNP